MIDDDWLGRAELARHVAHMNDYSYITRRDYIDMTISLYVIFRKRAL